MASWHVVMNLSTRNGSSRSADTTGRDGASASGRPAGRQRDGLQIRTGISWRDLPESYGPWKTVYTRFRRYGGHPPKGFSVATGG
ncbi:transposase [Streptomyces sp. PanSC9]|uniref:transposase n=1 Tax=Streptomyces sp. PanSC9 TaxID=1520461 RepID=UPI000F47F15A